MGEALVLTSGFLTNPGATVTPYTISPGDSFTVKSFDSPATADIVQLWTYNATGGIIRIRSPRLHDNVQGIRLQIPAATYMEYFPRVLKQQLYSVDTLIVEGTGGGAEVDVMSMLQYYSNLGGSQQQLATWAQISGHIMDYCGVELDLTSGATAGNYGGTRTLNQDFQNLKADSTYAWLGYTCASAFGTLALFGPDTSNYYIGGPGTINTDISADWFVRLNQYLGFPTIPLIKANNQGATNIAIVSADTATAHHVSLLLARLS